MKPWPKGHVYINTSNHANISNSHHYDEFIQLIKDGVGSPSSNNSTKAYDEENNAMRHVKKSYLHRPREFPYADMIYWIIIEANIDTKKIINAQGRCITSFMPSDLKVC